MEIDGLRADDLPKIHQGLKMLAKNTRAAKGTMIGIAHTDDAKRFVEEADDIEQRLMPKFQTQGTLALAEDGDDEESEPDLELDD